MFPRLEIVKTKAELLAPPHVKDDDDYTKRYGQMTDLILEHVLDVASAFTNIPVAELPEGLDTTLAIMTSSHLTAFGLLNTDAELAANALDPVKSLTEGDTQIQYDTSLTLTKKLMEAQAANPLTANLKKILLQFRRVAK